MLESRKTERKWCHQTHECNKIFDSLAARHREEAIGTIRGRITSLALGPHVPAWVQTGCQCDEKTRMAKNEEDWKTYGSKLPQLIYSYVDLTLRLFIVCIYLLGSWILPAVHSHSLASNFTRQLGRCCWQFVVYISIAKKKVNGLKCFDWTIGLMCLFYQIGCVQKKTIVVLSVHSCGVFDCLLVFHIQSENLHAVIFILLTKLQTASNLLCGSWRPDLVCCHLIQTAYIFNLYKQPQQQQRLLFVTSFQSVAFLPLVVINGGTN